MMLLKKFADAAFDNINAIAQSIRFLLIGYDVGDEAL